jgi:hypothetical protein
VQHERRGHHEDRTAPQNADGRPLHAERRAVQRLRRKGDRLVSMSAARSDLESRRVKHKLEPACAEYAFDRAECFLDQLAPWAEPWCTFRPESWWFRGQRNADWALTPSATRSKGFSLREPGKRRRVKQRTRVTRSGTKAPWLTTSFGLAPVPVCPSPTGRNESGCSGRASDPSEAAGARNVTARRLRADPTRGGRLPERRLRHRTRKTPC